MTDWTKSTMPVPVHLLKEASEQEEHLQKGKFWEFGYRTEKVKWQIVK